jgi:hypothetical protein
MAKSYHSIAFARHVVITARRARTVREVAPARTDIRAPYLPRHAAGLMNRSSVGG